MNWTVLVRFPQEDESWSVWKIAATFHTLNDCWTSHRLASEYLKNSWTAKGQAKMVHKKSRVLIKKQRSVLSPRWFPSDMK